MIIGTGVTKTFTGDSIFKNVDFKLGNNKKVALVGKNGCGKSTLFKIIVGQENIDSGSVSIQSEKIGYIPQEFNFPNDFVGAYLESKLENSWDFHKVDKLVDNLEFTNFDLYQEISTLSEGQKMKLKILETMLEEPTILLVDEPTNHLDIEGILWFESYIKKLNKTVLMISHDRQFLNNTIDEIWEIDNKQLYKFMGDYDDYKEEKLKLIGQWDEDYKAFVKKKKQLESLLEGVKKIKGGSKRGNAVRAVKKRIDREIIANKKEKYESKIMQSVDFKTGIGHAKLMIRFDKISKKYNKNTVFSDLSFDFRGGEKVWLLGPNGAGKSTMVKLMVGQETSTSGRVVVANNISIGYFAQKQTHLDYDKTLLEFFIKETGCYYGDAFGELKHFMFEKDDLQKKVGNLSPGQRARFAFAVFAYKNYDMLILDEPDNHLDIETKEVLENSLRDYKGTLLLISHDRFFVERVGVDKILNLKNGRLSEY